jgi:hypothetical protein
MCDDKKPESIPESPESMITGNLPEQIGEETQGELVAKPDAQAGSKIHPRQIIPPLPEGEHVPDDTPSPPVDLD